MSVKRAKKSKNEFDESMKRKSVAENISVGNSYETVTSYPSSSIATTRMTSVNPQPASGRVITWDDTKFAIGICYFDEQLQYLRIYNIWVTQSPYTCRDYPYMSITIRKLDDAEITPLEIGDVRLMLADTVLPYEPYGATIWHDCAVKRYTSRSEQNTSTGTFTYKGLTLVKNQTDIKATGTSTDIISSTDQFFKDNFSILLEAGKTYTIFGQNIVVDDSYIDVRYRDNDNIITTVGYYELPNAVTITPNTDTYIYMGLGVSAGVQCSVGKFIAEVSRQAGWYDTPVYVQGWYPNIFDVDSVQNIICNNMVTTSGFSNVGGVITLTKSVGNDGRYAYNELLNFEANEVYEITFDVLLEGTNSSNFISIAVLDPLNMGVVSTDLFNYPVEKDTWTSVAEELTLSATQGALSIQARNTGNSIKIKNVILRKKGHTWNKQ